MVHQQAQVGFGRAAEVYERGRPEYPRAAIEWLVERLELRRARTVLDVGAGTGKLTRALVPTGARLIALEPVAQMRDALRRQVPGVLALAGQAEEVPLPQDSVDAIVAGQSFHWFDGPRALAEFHRVMRPGGRLGLVWNRRDLSQPLHQAIDQIIAPHRGDTPAHDSDHWARAFEGSPLFHPADRLRVPFEQVLDADGFVERVMSISFVAALAGPERESVRARLRALVDSQLAPLRHVTEVFCYVATVSAPSSATPRATSIE